MLNDLITTWRRGQRHYDNNTRSSLAGEQLWRFSPRNGCKLLGFFLSKTTQCRLPSRAFMDGGRSYQTHRSSCADLALESYAIITRTRYWKRAFWKEPEEEKTSANENLALFNSDP